MHIYELKYKYLKQGAYLMKKFLCVMFLAIIFFPAALFAAGTDESSKCDTKYPVILSHGMGASYEIAWGIEKYWHNIPDALQDEGAEVYITSVDAMGTTAEKAAQWYRQLLEIKAATGAEKFNVIGHSHGSVYTRYAISNFKGCDAMIASHTSIAGPHGGSAMAEVVLGLVDDTFIGDLIDAAIKLIMSNNNADTAANLADLTRDFMINDFNPNVPNMDGIYYQSYAYKIASLAGAGLFAATWPIMKYFEGDNDGLVSVTSARWGTFRGVIKGTSWIGVNHLGAVDMLWGITPGFDAPEFFVDVVSELKDWGF